MNTDTNANYDLVIIGSGAALYSGRYRLKTLKATNPEAPVQLNESRN